MNWALSQSFTKLKVEKMFTLQEISSLYFCIPVPNLILKNLRFLVPKLIYLKKKSFLLCELLHCRLQKTIISLITVRGQNLQKSYYICRQK